MKTVVHLSDLVGGLEENHARIKECLGAMPATVELPADYAQLSPIQLANIFRGNVELLLSDGSLSVADVLAHIQQDPTPFLLESSEAKQALASLYQ